MRSLFKTLTITAFALSSLAGISAAAPMGDAGMHPGRQAHAADQPSQDSVTTPAPVFVRSGTAMHMHPRLATVLHEVRVARHRIAMDRQHGLLTKTEARHLEARAMHIRHEALRIAATHRGRLPGGTFATLQHDLRRLDRAVGRMA